MYGSISGITLSGSNAAVGTIGVEDDNVNVLSFANIPEIYVDPASPRTSYCCTSSATAILPALGTNTKLVSAIFSSLNSMRPK